MTISPHQDNDWMTEALAEAQRAARSKEVPIGAVIVRNGVAIARAHNEMYLRGDPTAHAEMLALQRACLYLAKIGAPERFLSACDLYVTIEPCPMCAGAIAHTRIRRLYYAASDPKGGGIENPYSVFSSGTRYSHPEIYSGLRESEALHLMHEFFTARRSTNARSTESL